MFGILPRTVAIVFTVATWSFNKNTENFDTSVTTSSSDDNNKPPVFHLDSCNKIRVAVHGLTCELKPENRSKGTGNNEPTALWNPIGDGIKFTADFNLSDKIESDASSVEIQAVVCTWDDERIDVYHGTSDYNSIPKPDASGNMASSVIFGRGFYSRGAVSCNFARELYPRGSVVVLVENGRLKPVAQFEQVRIASGHWISAGNENPLFGSMDEDVRRILIITAWALIAIAETIQPRFHWQVWTSSFPYGLRTALVNYHMLVAASLTTVSYILASTAMKGINSGNLVSVFQILAIAYWTSMVTIFFRGLCTQQQFVQFEPIVDRIYYTVGMSVIPLVVMQCIFGLLWSQVQTSLLWTDLLILIGIILRPAAEIVLEMPECFFSFFC